MEVREHVYEPAPTPRNSFPALKTPLPEPVDPSPAAPESPFPAALAILHRRSIAQIERLMAVRAKIAGAAKDLRAGR